MPDLYEMNLVQLQLAYQNVALNINPIQGGFIALMADVDAPLTRAIMKFFWRHKPPEQVDIELDLFREKCTTENRAALIITIVPRLGIYRLLQELTQSEVLVRDGPARRGDSLMVLLEQTPPEGHFLTLIIINVDDNMVTHVKITPCD